MRKLVLIVLCGVSLLASAANAANWVEGQNYFLIKPAQPTDVAPGKVEVVEVFSYGCPACYQFYPTADKLKAALPKNADMRFIPASWNPGEDWPMFQRAFLAAQALGIAEKTHDAMFNAIWASDELAVVDSRTNRIKSPLPTIENAAAFYARTAGVKKDEFLQMAKSFSIEVAIKRADATIKAYRAESTPTIVVNGKYRVTPQSAGGANETIELVKYLVAKESKQTP
jgi:protein dithiol oxidoreductase (disulfide-forming)